MNDYIKLEDCVNGGFYRIASRNLTFGVFQSDTNGFIGIREKFDEEYLFTEYHWDTGPPFGTVTPKELIGMCPIVNLRESIGCFDLATNREVVFDKSIANGGKGWYYLDTGEASEAIRPVSKDNQELFDWLKENSK